MAFLIHTLGQLKNSLKSTAVTYQSTDGRQLSTRQKRRGNVNCDDQFWCETGLDQDGFECKFISKNIGYGVFTQKLFPKGSFLLEYVGERISKDEANIRERKRRGKRCYMYHFKWNGNHCVDATTVTDRLARYINDAPSGDVRNNSTMKLKVFNNYPRLCLYASRDIVAGEEVRYDYGDHNQNLPWRQQEVASANSTHISESEDSDPFELEDHDDSSDSFIVENSESSTSSLAMSNPLADLTALRKSPHLNENHVVSRHGETDVLIDKKQEAYKEQQKKDKDQDEDQEEDQETRHSWKTDVSVAQKQKAFKEQQKEDEAQDGDQDEDQHEHVETRCSGETDISEQQKEDKDQNEENEDQDQHVENRCSLETDVSVAKKQEAFKEQQKEDQDEDANEDQHEHVETRCSGETDVSVTKKHEALKEQQKEDEAQDGDQDEDQHEHVETRCSGETDISEQEKEDKDQNEEEDEDQDQHVENRCSLETDVSVAKNQEAFKEQQKEDQYEVIEDQDEHVDSIRSGEIDVSVVKKPKTYKKPDRFCTYCNNVITSGKLKRHIKRKHKNEQEIKEILSKPANIQNAFFDLKRREGIYEYNLKLMSEDKEPKLRERTPKYNDSLRVCMDCKSYFSNKYFFKHKCTATAKPEALKPSLLQKTEDRIDQDTEFINILNRFRDGEVGEICRTNKTIRMIGYRHFNLRRHEESKKDEVRKVVTAEMRELARLYLKYQEISGEKTVESMFRRENLQDLKEAIEQMVVVGNGEKHGQKLFLDAVILRSIKALRGFYAETMQDEKGKELKNFKEAYKFKSCEMYPSARQQSIKNSMEKLRKPANLPNEIELLKLKLFLEFELQDLLKNFRVEKYPYLRTLLVSRLTLFNARRGEEASRMLLSEWEDAERDEWLPADMIEHVEDEGEKYLTGQFKLAYLKGKGRKFVPLLVPNDLLQGIRLLLSYRQEFGIPETNVFLFATKSAASHCSGWHAIKDVCTKANVQIPVTAGKMRHRLSTIYASLHMEKDNQKTFLDHMGHDLDINKDNYQCPPGIKTVCVMGKILTDVDEGHAITKNASLEVIGKLNEVIDANEHDPDDDTTVNEDDDGPSRKRKARYYSGHAITKNVTPEISGNLNDVIDANELDPDDDTFANGEDDDGPSWKKKARYYSDDDYDCDDDDDDYVDDDDDDDDEVEEETVIQHQRKERSTSVKWSEYDTKNLRCYFEDCVYSNKDSNNKGKLPSKDQILQFLQKFKPASVQKLDNHQQYLKTRMKLFNERKTLRAKVKGKLQKLLKRK